MIHHTNLNKILSASSLGLNSFLVEIEADVQNSKPKFIIVGLADTAIQEAKERVKAAILNSDIRFPRTGTIINLAPADLKKIGNGFDLPIALAILQKRKMIPAENELYQKSLFVGELSFDGSLRPISNIISICLFAKENNFKNIFLPFENKQEASAISEINIFPVQNLNQIIQHLKNKEKIEIYQNSSKRKKIVLNNEYDFSLIKGQAHAKRALTISAAGGHNVLMNGSPGSGKTLLSRSLPSILPDLNDQEILEVSRIYSAIGLLNKEKPLITARPFRAPHHSSSLVSLVGGGSIPRPGEVSLAHRGVLFLDEMPEFPKQTLETLRQPLEDGRVTIARAQITLEFPARFILIGAQNPCPCGYYGDEEKECTCTSMQIKNYNQKISGPLLDRIDMHIFVNRVKYKELEENKKAESSKNIKEKVIQARQIQNQRFKSENIFTNSEMNLRNIRKYCLIPEDAKNLLKQAVQTYNLSARAYFRLLKVSRTIADLENSPNLKTEHIAEALQYRKVE
jgi:magnesium chelatase family protein